MRTQSGICIELDQDRSIFLIKNGEFVRGTPVGNPLIGEEAAFYPHEKQRAVRWQPIMAPVIAAVAVLALVLSVLAFPEEEEFSYVQVEINPGIELGLNDQYEVVSLRELNSDGNKLIRELGDWENDSLTSVLNRVFTLAVDEQTEQIIITSVEEDGNKLEQSIKNMVLAASSVAKNEGLAVKMKEATREQWRQSKEDLVPMGQLVDDAESLNIPQEPEVQLPVKESETVPTPKENKAVKGQEPSSENNAESHNNKETKTTKGQKETNTNKPEEKKKSASPAAEKKTVPAAVEKKNNKPSPNTEKPQKTAKPNIKSNDSSKKSKNTSPVKEHLEPKEKPPESKEKRKPVHEDKEQKRSEDSNQQKKSEASNQQKKKDPSDASGSAVNKKLHNPPGQVKKKQENVGELDEEKQKMKKPSENEAKRGNAEKE